MNNFKPCKPHWSLAIKPGDNSRWVTVGAGWNTERGGINLHLDRNCTIGDLVKLLHQSDGRMMLFQNENDGPPPPRRRQPVKRPIQRDYMEEKRADRQPVAPPQPDADAPTGEPEDGPGWL